MQKTKSRKRQNLVISILTFILILPIFLFAPLVMAQPNFGTGYAENIGLSGAANADPRDAAVDVVRYMMTFLGIISVIVILLGGFRWMTAAGNEDRIADAKKTIVSGVIGLIIILAAFAIVTFVITTTTNLLES